MFLNHTVHASTFYAHFFQITPSKSSNGTIFTFSALTLFFLTLTACLHTYLLIRFFRSCAASFFFLMSWPTTLSLELDPFVSFAEPFSVLVTFFVPPNCISRFLMLVSFVFLVVTVLLSCTSLCPAVYIRQYIKEKNICVNCVCLYLFPFSFHLTLLAMCVTSLQVRSSSFPPPLSFLPILLSLRCVTVFSECTSLQVRSSSNSLAKAIFGKLNCSQAIHLH